MYLWFIAVFFAVCVQVVDGGELSSVWVGKQLQPSRVAVGPVPSYRGLRVSDVLGFRGSATSAGCFYRVVRALVMMVSKSILRVSSKRTINSLNN